MNTMEHVQRSEDNLERWPSSFTSFKERSLCCCTFICILLLLALEFPVAVMFLLSILPQEGSDYRYMNNSHPHPGKNTNAVPLLPHIIQLCFLQLEKSQGSAHSNHSYPVDKLLPGKTTIMIRLGQDMQCPDFT